MEFKESIREANPVEEIASQSHMAKQALKSAKPSDKKGPADD